MTKELEDNKEYVLAIDPALSTTGYAVICKDDCSLTYVNKMTTSNKRTDDDRINDIITRMFAVVVRYNIKDIVLEDGYLGPNPKTCIQLATLRGAIIGVFGYARYNVVHMLPSEIRKEFGVGGNAKKEEVAEKVMELYGKDNILNRIGPYSDKQNKDKTSDMYDAVSIGVAHVRKCKNGKQ